MARLPIKTLKGNLMNEKELLEERERINQLLESVHGMVVIPLKEYEELVERDNFLTCLESMGVDNWVGYGDAQEMMYPE